MDSQTLRVVSRHGLFWIAYFLYSWLAFGSLRTAYDGCQFGNPYESELYYSLVYVPLLAGGVYFTIYVLIERFFLRQRYRLFFALLAVTVVSIALLYRAVSYWWILPLYRPDLVHNVPLFFFPKILTSVIDFCTQLGVAVMLYFVNQWYRQKRLTQQLQLDKREAELELLKSQVQPHFIFNTLNNIYALSVKNSPQTSEMIYRLSSLLDYMLYDSQQTHIPLKHELEYISNYINLQKIRYGSHLNVRVTLADGSDDWFIAPLLLLPFIENSFKHGVSHQLAGSWIAFETRREFDELVIHIANSCSAPNTASDKSGIGLQNIRRRLELLYPETHSLAIQREPAAFRVTLRLPLMALRNPYRLDRPTDLDPQPVYENEMPDRG